MNFKKIITTVIAGASLLTLMGSASAVVNGDINIYGASAQYNFWKGEANTFLTGEGCTGVKSAVTTDGKNAISQATCQGKTINFRVSSKASYDGPLAIQGNTTNPNRTTACSDAHQRMMMDPTLVTSWGTPASPSTMPNTAVNCFTVTGGASDVQVTSFQQESHGMLLGPSTATNNVWTDRNFKGTGAVTSTGLTDCRSLVVPFAFYVNNNVTTTSGELANLTTAQARLIFSGQIGDWSDMAGFNPRPINVCWRHAGSGTHATIDLAVMRPAGLNLQQDNTSGTYTWYFNDGSADEMNCINSQAGGVGYADADQSLSSYTNTHQVTYNGVVANKANIVAGAYDFFTIQNLYTATPVPADMTTLCNFMKVPANNTNAYYASECELHYDKTSDDAYLTINSNPCF